MPADHPREREAKFEVSTTQLTALLAAANDLDGYTTQTIGLLSQTDTYMDTPAFELLRHGLALRVRHNGSAYETGIKSIQSTRKGAIQERMDVTIALPADAKPFDATTWPDAVEEQLNGYSIKIEEIRPIVVIRQERRKAHLSLPDRHRHLAEWSMDEVWVSAPTGGEISADTDDRRGLAGDTNQGGAAEDDADAAIGTSPTAKDDSSPASHFYELEIEWLPPSGDTVLIQEDESAFSALVDQVQKKFELTPIHKSKFVRGLEAALAQSHDNRFAISAEMKLEAAGRLLLHQQLIQMNLNEHSVRYSKNVKYVHDMRVAIRRALAAMKLLQHAISPKRLAPYTKGLRRLGRALGAVRDLDVAIENLRIFGRSLPEGQRQALKRVRSSLSSRRSHAHDDLVALLDSKKHRKFVIEFSAFCVTPSPDRAQSDESPYEFFPTEVHHCVPSIILRAFEAVRCYEVAFRGEELPELDTYHALRIQTKYLRYLLEFTQHLLGCDGDTLVGQLQGLQEHLGELNDARVEQERFHDWADKVKKDDELREAIATRLSQSSARIDQLRIGAPARLNDFVKASTRRKLATALASI